MQGKYIPKTQTTNKKIKLKKNLQKFWKKKKKEVWYIKIKDMKSHNTKHKVLIQRYVEFKNKIH